MDPPSSRFAPSSLGGMHPIRLSHQSPLTNHQSQAQAKCHTTQSNFARNLLKTNKNGTRKVTHFFKLPAAPVTFLAPKRYIELQFQLPRAWGTCMMSRHFPYKSTIRRLTMAARTAMGEMIAVNDLVKNYGDFCAVNHVSFSVPEGLIFGFLGPNGAGKTTTIKMLTTVLDPTSGSIRVNGHDPTREQKKVRQSFGIVFQDPSLDDELTAYENMDLHGILYGVGRGERHKRIYMLIDLVGLGERKKDFVKTYSGGMKRRLEVARALLHKPRILFLDEPTIGLDPQTRNHIWGYIQQLSKTEGVTVFFTTHYMDEADRVANDVAVIDHGKIVAQGSPGALKEQAQCTNLEDAFIALTGHAIREEEANAADRMRQFGRAWRGGGRR
jgi:ABC-2 type transport system ATP-binding protein